MVCIKKMNIQLPSLLTLPFDVHRTNRSHKDNFSAIRQEASSASNQLIAIAVTGQNYLNQRSEVSLIEMAYRHDKIFCDYIDSIVMGESVSDDKIHEIKFSDFDALVDAVVVVERERMEKRWNMEMRPLLTNQLIPQLNHNLDDLLRPEKLLLEQQLEQLNGMGDEVDWDDQINLLKKHKQTASNDIVRAKTDLANNRKQFHEAKTTEEKNQILKEKERLTKLIDKVTIYLQKNNAEQQHRIQTLRADKQQRLNEVIGNFQETQKTLDRYNESLQQTPEDRFRRDQVLSGSQSWLINFCRHYQPKVDARLLAYRTERTEVASHRLGVKQFRGTGYHQLTDQCYIIDDGVDRAKSKFNTSNKSTQPYDINTNERPSIYAMITYLMTHLQIEGDMNQTYFHQTPNSKEEVLHFLISLMNMIVYKLECFQYAVVGRLQDYLTHLDHNKNPDTPHEKSINGVWLNYLMHRGLLYELFCLHVKLRVFLRLEDQDDPKRLSSLPFFIMPYMDVNVPRENTVLHLTRNWRNIWVNYIKKYKGSFPTTVVLQNPIDHTVPGGLTAFDSMPFVRGGPTQLSTHYLIQRGTRSLNNFFIANMDPCRKMTVPSEILKPFIRSMFTWLATHFNQRPWVDGINYLAKDQREFDVIKIRESKIDCFRLTLPYIDKFKDHWKEYLKLRTTEMASTISAFETLFSGHKEFNKWLSDEKKVEDKQNIIKKCLEQYSHNTGQLDTDIKNAQSRLNHYEREVNKMFDDPLIVQWDDSNRTTPRFEFPSRKLARFCLFAIAHKSTINTFRTHSDRKAFDRHVGRRSLYDFFTLLEQHNLSITYSVGNSRGLAVFAERTGLF